MTLNSHCNEKKGLFWIGGGLGLIALIGIIISFFFKYDELLLWITRHSKSLQIWSEQFKALATLSYFATLTIAATIGVPPTGAIIFAGGALLGPGTAFFVALPAVGLGALGPFLVTRRFGAPWLERRFGNSVAKLQQGAGG